MSFRLHPHETIAKGIRRVLLSQVDAAAQRLDRQGDAPEGIHEARKCFKRIRATLRLVRSSLGEADFKRENDAFREMAGLLAGARDRHVLLQTALKLGGGTVEAKSTPEAEGETRSGTGTPLARAVAQLKIVLQAPASESSDSATQAAKVARARHALDAARKRIRRLQMEQDGFSPIAKGLRQAQRDLATSMATALAEDTDEAFHDWRKAVQRHWRHMKLLSACWPAYFEARAAAARELSQLLGDDHDLSMLIAFAQDRGRSKLTARMARELTDACRAHQRALRTAATTIGARLAADRPGSLARHVEALWEIAAAHGSTAKADGEPSD